MHGDYHESVLLAGQPEPRRRWTDVLGAGGYTTNLVKAALFTAERAKRTATPTSRGRRTTLMRGPAWVWTVR